MTATQRTKTEQALAASLLLLYRKHRLVALKRIGAPASDPPADAIRRIKAFAKERAGLMQTGINQRLRAAEASPEPNAVPQAKKEIRKYNAGVLTPFLVSWAKHAATVETYQNTMTPDGKPAAETVLWSWDQLTDFDDECADAEDASPASLDTLLSITGGPPPIHSKCLCTLDVD